jgi:endoglucanase
MKSAADAVHVANPSLLIFLSGLLGDTDISPITLGTPLIGTTPDQSVTFRKSDFPYVDKLVLELHKYDFEATHLDCPTWIRNLYDAGFNALNDSDPRVANVMPVVLTEWGFAQDGAYWNSTTYARCLREFAGLYEVGWMQWEVGGSYYVRSGVQDSDETWGLLDHEWRHWRSWSAIENSVEPMVRLSLGKSR